MKTCLFALLLALVLAETSAHAQTFLLHRSTAPGTALFNRPLQLPAKRKLGQVLAGAAAGATLGAIGGYAGYIVEGCGGNDDEFLCGLVGVPVGIMVGHVLGSAFTVYAMGRTAETAGSMGFTLLGSVVGLGLSLPVLSDPAGLGDYIAIPILVLGAPVGATLLNNLTRRYRNPSQQSGLLNFDRSGFYLGVPAVEAVRLVDPHRTVARSVRLFTASW